MRPVTRNFLLAMGVLALLLLALGALPSYLKSGDPYYLTATPTGETVNQTANGTTVDASNLSEQRYPYTTEALTNATTSRAGQSTPYWRGPIGIKGAFPHSPFDEYDSLAQQYPAATDGDGVRVGHDGTVYRLAVTQDP
jgi:hypothetical protein